MPPQIVSPLIYPPAAFVFVDSIGFAAMMDNAEHLDEEGIVLSAFFGQMSYTVPSAQPLRGYIGAHTCRP